MFCSSLFPGHPPKLLAWSMCSTPWANNGSIFCVSIREAWWSLDKVFFRKPIHCHTYKGVGPVFWVVLNNWQYAEQYWAGLFLPWTLTLNCHWSCKKSELRIFLCHSGACRSARISWPLSQTSALDSQWPQWSRGGASLNPHSTWVPWASSLQRFLYFSKAHLIPFVPMSSFRFTLVLSLLLPTNPYNDKHICLHSTEYSYRCPLMLFQHSEYLLFENHMIVHFKEAIYVIWLKNSFKNMM